MVVKKARKDGEPKGIPIEGRMVSRTKVDVSDGALLIQYELPAKYIQKRNKPCPCGSGKKFKTCCYGKSVEE